MKLNRKFNTLSPSEYRDIIKNYKRYANFNPLGLYRSILENPKLNTETQLEILHLANEYFGKFYEFLIVKDIDTYAELTLIGKEPLTHTEYRQYTDKLREKAKKILKEKRIRNWRVGIYTKSSRWAGYDEQKGKPISVEIMSKEPSQKKYKPTQVAHIKARKHKAAMIRREIDMGDE